MILYCSISLISPTLISGIGLIIPVVIREDGVVICGLSYEMIIIFPWWMWWTGPIVVAVMTISTGRSGILWVCRSWSDWSWARAVHWIIPGAERERRESWWCLVIIFSLSVFSPLPHISVVRVLVAGSFPELCVITPVITIVQTRTGNIKFIILLTLQ